MRAGEIVELIKQNYSVEVWCKLDNLCGSFFSVDKNAAIETLTMFGLDCFVFCGIEDRTIYLG